MSDQNAIPFWKKLTNPFMNRFNGRSGSSGDPEDKPVEHKQHNVYSHDYDINKIELPIRRVLVSQALKYHERIGSVISAYQTAQERDLLLPITTQIDECMAGLYRLALVAPSTAPIAMQETESATSTIAADQPTKPGFSFNDALISTNPSKMPTSRFSIPAQSIDAIIGQQIEDILTALGTAYSLLLLLGREEIKVSRIQRIQDLLASHLTQLKSVMASPEVVTLAPVSPLLLDE